MIFTGRTNVKQERFFDILAKLLSFFVITGVFFMCKNPKTHHIFKNINVEKAISDTFSVYRTSSNTFLDELKSTAITTQKSQAPVFNPEVVNEFENQEQSPEPVYETQVKYYNSGDFINYDDVLIKNHTKHEINAESLMEGYTPPKKKKSPQILIVHTHATEGFSDQATSRTTDTEKNVVKIGSVLEKYLEEKGFNVLHDIVLHDYPNYNGSYKNALKTIEWYLEHYPEINIVLDIHRDAIVTADGNRTKLTYNYNGKKAAQLMVVTGTNQGGLTHENWRENLKFAIGLQGVANKMYDGLMRPIDLRVERFNGHVTNNALIVEFGTDGNTLDEALLSAKLLSEIINEYIR